MELLISCILASIIIIIGLALNLKNATLNFLFQTIPVIIPTFIIWKNKPRNFLKLMIFKKRDIKFSYEVKISQCNLNCTNFDNIVKTLLHFDCVINGNQYNIIHNTKDDLLFSAYINVDTTDVQIDYYIESKTLCIHSSDMISYNVFIKRIKLLNNSLNESLSSIIYKNILIKLKIDFLSTIKKECRNPFVQKIFDGFNKKIVSLTYIGKNSSHVTITNNSIEFLANNIDSINYDIVSELSPLSLFHLNK